ncbi:tetratricopeptide repeat protein [Actinoplanes sp. TFC3]|uniref:tetratricopeptide repeat protein n=1 Tax=Actinoplanes sp. TFC3 TaxID=1710355 RepID=UPI0008299129|nr:tetratricopeptide repeat protein [Actinoplanes sp. TFC3]
MSSEPTSQSEPETTPEEYRQRALLLADLGRYDEAAGEVAAGLAVAPGRAALLTTLAKIHIAAAQPADALSAADRAASAAPDTIDPLITRAMALTDDRRYGEAAQVASEILTRWPQDPVAQRTGAGLLSESRNGQDALNAAWNGVRLTPREAEAHLVLAVVAARLRLFDLAQRAYSEALDLEPAIADAQRDVGIVRLERRRWAVALESLADEATLAAQAPDPEADTEPTPIVEVSRPVLDRSGATADAVRQAVLYGSNGVVVAAVLSAVMNLASPGVARMWAGVMGVTILVAVGVWTVRQVRPESLGAVLSRLRRTDRRLTVAAGAVTLAPVLLIVHAAVGGLVALVAAMVVAAVAELVVLTHHRA